MLDVDLEKDLLHISYDPKKVTPEGMVETVRKEGFEANVVPGDP